MRAETGSFTAYEAAQACKGRVVYCDPAAVFGGVSTDTRSLKENDLFVALVGPNRDGHDFLFPALEAGARGSLIHRDIHRDILQKLTNHVLIQVQDTLLCLSDLASAHRKLYPIPLIAVTGSSGKTTVKEMIATVLRRSHRPLVSTANFNNLIGLPMTVLNLNADHTVAVVEAGINIMGEMEHLARAARPDVALITTVGPVHLEGLGSIENVAREKFKLVEALPESGTAVVPADNPWCKPFVPACRSRVVSFGVDSGDYRASNIVYGNETTFDMISPTGTRHVRLKVPGRHNIADFLAAAAACEAIGVDIQEAVEAIDDFTPPTLRMEILHLNDERFLIRDCYNANPQSMKAGLEVLADMNQGPKLAVLGDMAELGDRSAELHREIGKEAARLGIDRLVCVGTSGRFFAEGFSDAGGPDSSVTTVSNKDAAWKMIGPEIKHFRAILVKGSRVMQMELLADRILEEN